MYFLRLTCQPVEVDGISGELWEAGTAGIQELKNGGTVVLVASFETDERRSALLARFRSYSPEWSWGKPVDWVQQTCAAWPTRKVGERIVLAPHWNGEPTPPGRKRVIHNPGLTCGTGEHPCSHLALLALEECVDDGTSVVDIGTGSGILAIAALRLGAASAVGLDLDEAALRTAKENFALNTLPHRLVAGSAECLADHSADVVVANINASVLLSIFDDLLRIAKAGGWLILTGFPESEADVFVKSSRAAQVFAEDEWRCVAFRTSRA